MKMYENGLNKDILSQLAVDEKKNIDQIVKAINEKRCILFTGPDLYISKSQKASYLDQFANYLCQEFDLDLEEYGQYTLSEIIEVLIDSQRGSEKRLIRNVIQEAEEYFKSNVLGTRKSVNRTLQKIADIPFSLIINTTPDYLLSYAYQGNVYFDYYDYSNSKESLSNGRAVKSYLNNWPELEENGRKIGDINIPFIYNLFGNIEIPKSILVSERDRLKFIESIFVKKIPLLIREELKDEDNLFVLTGFDINEWYLKILLYLLELNSSNNLGFALQKNYSGVNKIGKIFFDNTYNCKVWDISSENFIDLIYENYNQQPAKTNYKKEMLIIHSFSDSDLKEELDKQFFANQNLIKTSYLSGKTPGCNNVSYVKECFEKAALILVIYTGNFKSEKYLSKTRTELEKLLNNDSKKEFIIVYGEDYLMTAAYANRVVIPKKDGQPMALRSNGVIKKDLSFSVARRIKAEIENML